jgi:hypothetical protein
MWENHSPPSRKVRREKKGKTHLHEVLSLSKSQRISAFSATLRQNVLFPANAPADKGYPAWVAIFPTTVAKDFLLEKAMDSRSIRG